MVLSHNSKSLLMNNSISLSIIQHHSLICLKILPIQREVTNEYTVIISHGCIKALWLHSYFNLLLLHNLKLVRSCLLDSCNHQVAISCHVVQGLQHCYEFHENHPISLEALDFEGLIVVF